MFGVTTPRDFANLYVVVPAVSHAVAGPSALKAGVLHGDDSAMWKRASVFLLTPRVLLRAPTDNSRTGELSLVREFV